MEDVIYNFFQVQRIEIQKAEVRLLKLKHCQMTMKEKKLTMDAEEVAVLVAQVLLHQKLWQEVNVLPLEKHRK